MQASFLKQIKPPHIAARSAFSLLCNRKALCIWARPRFDLIKKAQGGHTTIPSPRFGPPSLRHPRSSGGALILQSKSEPFVRYRLTTDSFPVFPSHFSPRDASSTVSSPRRPPRTRAEPSPAPLQARLPHLGLSPPLHHLHGVGGGRRGPAPQELHGGGQRGRARQRSAQVFLPLPSFLIA